MKSKKEETTTTMKRHRKVLGLLLVLLSGVMLSVGIASWAQKPQPPQPTPDPAIAFVAEKNFSREDLMVMNADGSNQTLVLEGGKSLGHHQPNWSPDGTQLAFISKIQGDGVYIINREGTGLRKVVALNAAASDFDGPAWSPVPAPDGRFKIAYSDRARKPDGTLEEDTDLFLVDVDGSGRVQLTNTRGLHELDPTWSPLATRLAAQVFDLVNDPLGESPDIIQYDLGLTPGNKVTIVSATNLTAAGPLSTGFVKSPGWAKTQDKIAVQGRLAGEDFSDIWVIDLVDAANPVNLTRTPARSERDPSWSPDDSRIVFVMTPSEPGSKPSIFVMNADGTGVTKIAQPGKNVFGFNEPDWRRNP